MKLLVCATEYYPHGSGIANVAYNVVEKLKERGVDCTVCSPTGPDIVIGSKKLISKFGRLGLLYYWYQVQKYFSKKNEYDAVWLHQPLLLSEQPFSNSISTIHITSLGHFRATKKLNKSVFFKYYYFISSLIEKYSFKKTYSKTNFVVDSPQVGRELSEIVNINDKYKYIPNGVDTEQFKPFGQTQETRKELQIPTDKIVFIAVGRLSSPKNLYSMIDTFREIQIINNNCVLVICGDGEQKEQLKNYIYEQNIPNIIIKGYVPHNELPIWYGCADYYIMTSIYEGQPLTLLEAIASGLPCIVSDIPNLRIVEEADCGIVVDFSDEKSATKKISEYIQKDNSEHSTNARKCAENNLDWEIIADKYIEEFIQLSKH